MNQAVTPPPVITLPYGNRITRNTGRAVLCGFLAVLFLLLGLTPTAAETPGRVAEGVEDDGVFVGFRRIDIDEAALIAAVEDVRFDGLRLIAVAPRDPQPSAAAFARRVQEETDADVALVFPPDGQLETYVIEDLAAGRVRATLAAREFGDPARAVEAFAAEITSERESETPEIVGQLMNALVLMALVIGVVVAIEQIVAMIKRSRAAARSEASSEARSSVGSEQDVSVG